MRAWDFSMQTAQGKIIIDKKIRVCRWDSTIE